MKLQTRLSITLVAGVAAVLTVVQGLQYARLRSSFEALGESHARMLQKSLAEDAGNVQRVFEFGISEAMEAGDMDAFTKVAQMQKDLPGLQEFSLYNGKGIISYSSDPSHLKQPMDPEVKALLFAKPEPLTRDSAQQIEVYQPRVVSQTCLGCHAGWKPGMVAGVTLFRYSKQAVAKSLETTNQAESSSLLLAATAIGGSLVVIVVLVAVIILPVARRLGRVAEGLEHRAQQVNDTAVQVSAASLPIAEGASEQAASLEETSASLEEMAAMTKRNADDSVEASKLARQARSAAEKGAAEMADMKVAMEAIQTSSEGVGKIVKTIDEIAFQTNILALNAAVEAARAGEAGLSFAVVANEVRSLAQRCAQSARDTAAKIEGAMASASQGVELSAKVAAGLQEIVTKVRQVDELTAQVASASKEQSEGVSQINVAVAQMDKVTQSNAASAEQSAHAAEKLDSQAVALKDAVAELRALVDGHELVAQAMNSDPPASSAPIGSHSLAPTLEQPSSARSQSPPLAARASSTALLLRPAEGQTKSVAAPQTLIEWDHDRMTTGFREIDDEHRELMAMINRLHTACLNGTGKSELGKMLEFLGAYVQTHFSHEEELMEHHRCAAGDSNKIAHRKFLNEFEKLASEFKAKGESTTILLGLQSLVAQWLTSHICGVDTKMRACASAGAASRKAQTHAVQTPA